MPQRDMEREPQCTCGRELASITRIVHQTTSGLYVYWHCQCGQEWTEREQAIDRASPITADELLEVHECLGAFAGPLVELLRLGQT